MQNDTGFAVRIRRANEALLEALASVDAERRDALRRADSALEWANKNADTPEEHRLADVLAEFSSSLWRTS